MVVNIQIKNLKISVHETDEGVVADIYDMNDELITTTYAFFTDGDDKEE